MVSFLALWTPFSLKRSGVHLIGATPERMIALRLIPRFLGMVWRAQPGYAAAIVSFRVLLAFSPQG